MILVMQVLIQVHFVLCYLVIGQMVLQLDMAVLQTDLDFLMVAMLKD